MNGFLKRNVFSLNVSDVYVWLSPKHIVYSVQFTGQVLITSRPVSVVESNTTAFRFIAPNSGIGAVIRGHKFQANGSPNKVKPVFRTSNSCQSSIGVKNT